jgi:hypothetical protein
MNKHAAMLLHLVPGGEWRLKLFVSCLVIAESRCICLINSMPSFILAGFFFINSKRRSKAAYTHMSPNPFNTPYVSI